ncbi:MAG: adenylate kinase family protein, partial [Nitrososphaerales archaeon]
MIKGIIAVVGTPGTGKKTLSRLLSSHLQVEYLDVNEVAIQKGAVIGKDGEEYVVSTSKLRRILLPMSVGKPMILSGHLIPSVLNKSEVELVILLRCAPEVLEKRLAERGYSQDKIRENVAAEILGVVAAEALKRFGVKKVSEHDTSNKSPSDTFAEVLEVILGKAPLNAPKIDWLTKVAEKGLLQKYFQYS